MKIFVMTDMEGVAGIINREDWVLWDSRYYDTGRKLLTMEVNAAIDGLFEEGADEIHVIDGHGNGGINHLLLDSRVDFVRGFPGPWPFTLDESFDAIVWIGQHAKAGTEYAHIPHTGSHHVIDCRINDISVGEFGQLAFCAASMGVSPIFASGDEAFVKEARELVGNIGTAAVKKGLMPGSGDECTFEEYKDRNTAAIHIHPKKARKFIKEGVKDSLKRFIQSRESFLFPGTEPPYYMVKKYRPSGNKQGYTEKYEHPDNIIKMFNSRGKLI